MGFVQSKATQSFGCSGSWQIHDGLHEKPLENNPRKQSLWKQFLYFFFSYMSDIIGCENALNDVVMNIIIAIIAL